MDPELRQQLRVDDPMEEPELNLDGLPINSIQVLLEPPTEALAGDDEEDDGFYSPLDHFRNLVKLSMSSSQCQSLEGFPPLPLLRSLHLADNHLSSGFEALAEADLQSLVLLDLSANNIQEAAALAPLDALENLQHLMMEGNPVSDTQGYREAIFEVLPQLISLDSMDRDGTKLDVDEDALSSGDEDAHFPGNVDDEEEYDNDRGHHGEMEDEDEDIDQHSSHSHHYQPHSSSAGGDESEDIGSQDEDDEEEEYEGEVKHGSDEDEDSDVELDQERRPMTGGKTTGNYDQGDEDEDLEDEEEEEEEEEDDEGDVAHYQHHSSAQAPQQQQQQHVQEIHASGSEDEEDDDDEEEDDDDEEVEEEEESEEEDEEEAPGLAYLLTDDIPDENDDEFEPEADPEEESEMESSDEDEYGSSSNNNNNNNNIINNGNINKPVVLPTSAMTPAELAALSNINNGISSSSNHTNGHSSSTPSKRPRSPDVDDSTGIELTSGFDHGQVGDVGDGSEFVMDGDDDASGFGMASFDGPATFDDDSSLTHESKRPRT
ncbi:hypothetical protein BGX24_012005 [Mortierella sp. AD032]|nr:hypothetical protein BGX24_012005 [Mortierella sp. AD032]